jgi:hypothetical protein
MMMMMMMMMMISEIRGISAPGPRAILERRRHISDKGELTAANVHARACPRISLAEYRNGPDPRKLERGISVQRAIRDGERKRGYIGRPLILGPMGGNIPV